MEDSVLSWFLLNLIIVIGVIKLGSLFPVTEKKKDVYIKNTTSDEIYEKQQRNRKYY